MDPETGRSVARDFVKDESGVALVWVSLFILVILGVIGLAIDGGRFFNLNSDLQHIADAAALAGAKELDGAQGARERAIVAATTALAENAPHSAWSTDVSPDAIQIDMTLNPPTFHYYDKSLAKIVPAEDDAHAGYITVTTIWRGMRKSILSAVLPDQPNYTAAKATAKVEYSVCKPLQSFLCNPWEGDAVKRGAAANWKDHVQRGYMFKLTSGSGDGGGGNGSWGLIKPDDLSESDIAAVNGNSMVKALTPFWAALAPQACTTKGVGVPETSVMTGNLASFAAAGMNVRFDIGLKAENPHRSTGLEVAAPIVIKGWSPRGGSCDNQVSATPDAGLNCKFPAANPSGAAYRDYCNATYTQWVPDTKLNPACSALTGGSKRIGSCPLPRDDTLIERQAKRTSWKSFVMGTGPNPDDLKAYWKNQHGSYPWPWAAGDRPTRYDVYLKELELMDGGFFRSDSLEDPTPTCMATGEASRRIINVAIVDCDYWEIQGNSNPLPAVTTVARFFMTEKANDEGEVYAEYIDSYEASSVGGPNTAGSVVNQTVKLVE